MAEAILGVRELKDHGQTVTSWERAQHSFEQKSADVMAQVFRDTYVSRPEFNRAITAVRFTVEIEYLTERALPGPGAGLPDDLAAKLRADLAEEARDVSNG